ncbi:MAG: BstXI family restriction endonuclease [Bacteroidales bacterium]|nr:BstXI family restriction endonuclease [Bacteroidales bacterium]
MKAKLPKLPNLLSRKIYKTGQTRGADDDVIFQNRVNRNSTVLIPFDFYDKCSKAPDNDGIFENGFIVLIKPEDYYSNPSVIKQMKDLKLQLGVNALLFYETRSQWNNYNPVEKKLKIATSRINPLGGHYVARVPSTTAEDDEKIIHGYSTSGLKGAGIRVYEYASSNVIDQCQLQLEYIYWHCVDSHKVSLLAGMTEDEITQRKTSIIETCKEKGLANNEDLINVRIFNKQEHAVCPLCLEELSANGFLNRLEQAEGRDVPDLTVTQVNLFHIRELKTGEFNHKPYNLGWGHHHCNIVCKDSGIFDTLKWLKEILDRNIKMGVKF